MRFMNIAKLHHGNAGVRKGSSVLASSRHRPADPGSPTDRRAAVARCHCRRCRVQVLGIFLGRGATPPRRTRAGGLGLSGRARRARIRHRVVVHSKVALGCAAAVGLLHVHVIMCTSVLWHPLSLMHCSSFASRVARVAGPACVRGRAATEDAAMAGRAIVQMHLEGQARQTHGLVVSAGALHGRRLSCCSRTRSCGSKIRPRTFLGWCCRTNIAKPLRIRSVCEWIARIYEKQYQI